MALVYSLMNSTHVQEGRCVIEQLYANNKRHDKIHTCRLASGLWQTYHQPDLTLSINQGIDWMKIREIEFENYDPIEGWKEQQNEVKLVNSEQITDPNATLPVFDLSRQTWCQLNRIRSNHGRCNAMLHKWDPGIPSDCDCGSESQIVHHIVEECPIRISRLTG